MDCLIPLLHSEMLFFNTLNPATSILLYCDSLFFFGDCRQSYEDNDTLHTRDDVFFFLLFLSLFLYFFFSTIFFSLALYCTVWRWWLAPELAVMKWIYIYHAGAGGVEGKAARGKTKRVCEIRRKEALAWHALR